MKQKARVRNISQTLKIIFKIFVEFLLHCVERVRVNASKSRQHSLVNSSSCVIVGVRIVLERTVVGG